MGGLHHNVDVERLKTDSTLGIRKQFINFFFLNLVDVELMEIKFDQRGRRLACFDLDHTLLKPKGGKKFAQDEKDAVLVFLNIRQRLDELRRDGWTINIFTNQKKKKKELVPVDAILNKITRLLGESNVFISYHNDYYRKPAMGMWDELLALNGITTKEVIEAFYVGDAAGRPGDFSNSDRAFAHNIKVPFFTPEQYFQGKREILPERKTIWPQAIPFNMEMTRPTILIMIGRQGSGKSYLTTELQVNKKAVVVSNDLTKSSRKTQKLLRDIIMTKQELIIVDNTNPSLISRQPYLEIAREKGYRIIGVVCQLEDGFCRHLDAYRSYKKKIKRLPQVAFSVFNKKYQEPKIAEGFDLITNYIPDIPNEIKELWF